jgi:hypothetical protein
MTIKKCIDKTVAKLIKSLELPKYIQSHLTFEFQRVGNEPCFCILLDNMRVSNIPIEQLYLQPRNIIRKRIDLDIEEHVLKVYAKKIVR